MPEPEDEAEGASEGPEEWEFQTAFDGPAPGANRWFITTHGSTVRVGFCEQHNANHVPQYRAAVTLDHDDAVQFAKTIHEFMQRRDALLYGEAEPEPEPPERPVSPEAAKIAEMFGGKKDGP